MVISYKSGPIHAIQIIDTRHDQSSARTNRELARRVVAQVKGEDRLGDQALCVRARVHVGVKARVNQSRLIP